MNRKEKITNLKLIILISFILILLLKTVSLHGKSVNSLETMFYNPINLNTASKNKILEYLNELKFSKQKIHLLVSYLYHKENKPVTHFYSLVEREILDYNESKILSHFFILDNNIKSHLFESDIESDYSTEEDSVYDPDFKINLNRFRKEKMLSLSFMTEKMLEAIVSYRSKVGKYSSIYELLLIPEIDRITFIRLKHFLIRLEDDIYEYGNSLELRYRRGYKSDIPESKKERYFYTRLNLALEKGVEFNMSGIKTESQNASYPWSLFSEKDSYLKLYRQYSLSLYIEKENIGLQTIVLGDYTLRFGQHLTFGSTFPPFLDYIYHYPIKKQDQGIRKFTNPNRYGALRGIAFSTSIGIFELTPFVFINDYELANTRFSKSGVDISPERLINDSSVIADDIKQSKSLFETGAGINFSVRLGKTSKLGFNFAYTQYSDNLNPKIRDSKDEKLFRGNELYLSSLYFDWFIFSKLNLYGESAISLYKDTVLTNKKVMDTGSLLGGILDISIFKYSVLFRYLGNQFNSPHASSVIDERINEIGIFQGVFFQLQKDFTTRPYFDLFKPLEKNTFSKEFSLKVTYKVMHDLLLIYLFTITYKPYYATYRTRIKNQGNLEYWIIKNLSFRLRYENISSKRDNEDFKYYGDLFYTQFKYHFLKYLTSVVRVTVFNTEDFDAAVYAIENQLPYWFNGINSYADEGIKYDFMLKSDHKRFWLGLKFTIDDRKVLKERKTTKKLFLQAIYKW
ncbi:MAG: helix-hairpin-helix domain-containing protein [Spirochaetota bacterium]|nr:helix-hairpin-helix domain-containing protein [Spirochaetota bacterium]